MAKHAIEDCIEYATKHGGYCLSIEYHEYVEFKCGVAEHKSWKAPFAGMLKDNRWCEACSNKARGLRKRKYDVAFCQELAKSFDGYFLSTDITTVNQYYLFECRRQHQWQGWLSSIIAGHWCNKCAIIDRSLNLQECMEYAIYKDGKCLDEEYISNDTDMHWICDKNHIWEAPFRYVKCMEHWCPTCIDLVKSKYTWKDVLSKCNEFGLIFVNIPAVLEECIQHSENKNNEWQIKCFCGQVFYPLLRNILKNNTTSCGCRVTKTQDEIEKIINNFGFITIKNDRTLIAPKELDIFVLEKQIAIEYCGLRWHGEKFSGKEARNKHLNKLKLCKDKSIRLITIFEDEWVYKKEQVKGYLKAIFGKCENKIGARKCEIREVINQIAKQFHNDNHIQGHSNGKHIGLYFNNELVALSTFAKPSASRNNHRGNDSKIELMRYTVKINYSVRGGLGKLINYFVKNNNDIKEIISYSDNRWSEGNVYKTINFDLINNGHPGYWYTIRDKKFHRYNFTKHKAIELFGGDPNTDTEWDIMSRNGYDRIWDCGSSKWALKIK